jgi:fido (protein-threonine AMPylation protein)
MQSIPKASLAGNFVKKNSGGSRHINRIHPRTNGNTQEQRGFSGNLRWQAGSLSSHHKGERASQICLAKRKGTVAVSGDDANLSCSQTIQEFIGRQARQDRKVEDRAGR